MKRMARRVEGFPSIGTDQSMGSIHPHGQVENATGWEDTEGGGRWKGNQERHEGTKVEKVRLACGVDEVIPAKALVGNGRSKISLKKVGLRAQTLSTPMARSKTPPRLCASARGLRLRMGGAPQEWFGSGRRHHPLLWPGRKRHRALCGRHSCRWGRVGLFVTVNGWLLCDLPSDREWGESSSSFLSEPKQRMMSCSND